MAALPTAPPHRRSSRAACWSWRRQQAPQRTDHDYALSYIQREGKGRVFVELLGHDESIYKQTPMLAHILAGMQYVLGDLEADDSPSAQPRK